MALGFISTACTGSIGSYSLWMYALLSLDVVGRALDFSQGRVPCPLLGLEGGEVEGYLEEMEGGEGVGLWIGIF